MIAFTRVAQIISETRREQNEHFKGFRHANARRVVNMLNEEFRRLKKAGVFSRDNAGMPLVDKKSIEDVVNLVEKRIQKRTEKLGKEIDNGAGENRMILLRAVRRAFIKRLGEK
jgi:hypothetical protein